MSAWIEMLAGCAAWGYSKEEMVEAITDTVPSYLEVLAKTGHHISEEDAHHQSASRVDEDH